MVPCQARTRTNPGSSTSSIGISTRWPRFVPAAFAGTGLGGQAPSHYLQDQQCRRPRPVRHLAEGIESDSRRFMKRIFFSALIIFSALMTISGAGPSAQSADDIIARYVQRIGGADRIRAVRTLRRTGRF